MKTRKQSNTGRASRSTDKRTATPSPLHGEEREAERTTPENPTKRTDRPASSFPNVADGVVVLFLCFVAQITVGILTIGLSELLGVGMREPAVLWAAYFAAMGMTIILVAGYRKARGGRERLTNFSRAGFQPALILRSFILLLGFSFVLEPINEFLPKVAVSITPGFWGFLTVVICAPLMEEVLCRGLILKSIEKRHGILAAWILSACFFGVIHYQPAPMIYATLSGLVLAYAVIRTGSLWTPIVIHAMNNLVSYILLKSGHFDQSVIDLIPSPWLYWLLYAVVLAAVVRELSNIVRWVEKRAFVYKNGIDA